MNIQKYFKPINYYNKFIKYRTDLYSFFADEKKLINMQNEYFCKLNWNYNESLKLLNTILLENNLEVFDDSKKTMISQHLIAFCAIKNNDPQRILEIGTYDGKTTFLLSKIFPNSEIITFDLDQKSDLYKNTYNRSDATIKERINRLRKNFLNEKNIKFIEDNSFNIPKYKFSKFDLIWIDGDHNYPTVAWDLYNSLNLLTPNGYIFCDDVYINKSDTYTALQYLKEQNYAETSFILKRVSKKFSADPYIRKYIAIINKI